MKKIEIRQKKGIAGSLQNQKRTIVALGLGRPNYVVIHNDTPAIRGMIQKVQHLVEVKEVQ
jgi:large subunit ribosomal protein L30